MPNKRRALLWETLVGFLGFFTVVAAVQAIINVFSDSPAIWPGLLLLALLIPTFFAWRKWREVSSTPPRR